MTLSPNALPRLLAGLEESHWPMTQAEHERVHGPLPEFDSGHLIEMVELSGLRGRGGADFPMATKLRAVASGRRPAAVVVNGSETEPASGKDTLLLERLPHLVLDGAILSAETVGAGEVVVKVGEHAAIAIESLQAAIALRSTREVEITLAVGPSGYVTGEESAVIHFLNRGVAKPTLVPPRPFERGLRGRPTLVQNPETLAQLALVARHGPDWYRQLGTHADPGSALVTISGAVRLPGVYELAFGTSMHDLIEAAGGPSEPLQALLIGGYFGTWMPAHPGGPGLRLRLAREELHSVGCSLGAGVVIALGESACGLHETARIVSYLADQSAGQCGPCVHGLAAIAGSFADLVDGVANHNERKRLQRWCNEIRGRGACHHPNGAIRLLESAFQVFGQELGEHHARRCRARPAGLPFGAPSGGATDHAVSVPRAGAGTRRTRSRL
jgi:NADH:ubiquinone oxidoreductase subunit F (NADH-binding)